MHNEEGEEEKQRNGAENSGWSGRDEKGRERGEEGRQQTLWAAFARLTD